MATRDQKSLGAWLWVAALAIVTVAASYGMLRWVDDAPERASEELAPEYQRIVSLSPALTQTLVHIGAAKRMIGISDYCEDYPELADMRRVGTGLTPNYEGIVGLKPDLIVLETTKQADYKNLEAIGKTQPLAWLTLDEITKSTQLLGELTGTADAADALANKLSSALGTTGPSPKAPRVLLLLGLSNFDGGNLWYIKRNSLHGAGLVAAGGINAIDKDISGAPSISMEELLKVDPDMIITMVSQVEFTDAEKEIYLKRLNQLGPLKAVQNKQTGFIVGKQFMGTGPRILDFLEALKIEIERLAQGGTVP